MQPTAAHCREQQAVQLALAANEPLEARKKIALTAAAAWSEEAIAAGKREARKTALSELDTAIAQEFADEDQAQRMQET
jgi:hypothetical protein